MTKRKPECINKLSTTTDAEISSMRRWWREWMPTVTMLLLLVVARSSFANHYQVPSGSMEPTLMPGDRVAVSMMAYGLRVPFTTIELIDLGEPQAGEIVLLKSPVDGVRLIKRVAAVGGQTVILRDGRLSVDGSLTSHDNGKADNERIGTRTVQLDLRNGGGPDIDHIVVPDGMVLLLGDHRGNSLDSRYFGLVPAREIYARAKSVYYRRGEGLVWKTL